jgi:hypothetical protein
MSGTFAGVLQGSVERFAPIRISLKPLVVSDLNDSLQGCVMLLLRRQDEFCKPWDKTTYAHCTLEFSGPLPERFVTVGVVQPESGFGMFWVVLG